jgi:REP element-mobilizing transposase RayT
MSCVAIHTIWTTYMTWPPGDRRGHWSALFDFYGHLKDRGHQLNLPDPITLQYATANAKEPERVLTSCDQQIVAETVGQVLKEVHPRISIYAAAIERTHVHLLFGPSVHPIAKLVGLIKGRTSSDVIARGSEPWRTRTWTAGYWKVYVYDLLVIPEIQAYIERHNTRRGLAGAPYAWIEPFV